MRMFLFKKRRKYRFRDCNWKLFELEFDSAAKALEYARLKRFAYLGPIEQ